MASLAPTPQAVGVFSQFIAQGPETLVMKEKVMSLSGDSFSIKLANGTPLLKVEGKVMSIHGRKKMFDMQGNHICSIIKEHFHIHTTFAVEDPSGAKVMEVKSNFKLFGSKATATFTSQSGKQESLVMHGNWFDSSADIVDEAQGGLIVARINRKLLSGKDIFFGQQTYGVQIAPGVDMALIAALCICLDEKNNEPSG
ncbi:LOR domain containing protein [Pyrenophora teres f. maculata]|nr:LOR domain containing protein [Pyrenophora teres f. maculata]